MPRRLSQNEPRQAVDIALGRSARAADGRIVLLAWSEYESAPSGGTERWGGGVFGGMAEGQRKLLGHIVLLNAGSEARSRST